jgi:hypothetical protein
MLDLVTIKLINIIALATKKAIPKLKIIKRSKP